MEFVKWASNVLDSVDTTAAAQIQHHVTVAPTHKASAAIAPTSTAAAASTSSSPSRPPLPTSSSRPSPPSSGRGRRARLQRADITSPIASPAPEPPPEHPSSTSLSAPLDTSVLTPLDAAAPLPPPPTEEGAVQPATVNADDSQAASPSQVEEEAADANDSPAPSEGVGQVEAAPVTMAVASPAPPLPSASRGGGKSSAAASAASSAFSSFLSSATSSSPSASSASSPSDESSSAAEIASLRAVWQESRESLSKAKKLLQMKEESHAKALAKLSADWQATLEVQQSEYEVKLKALQTTLDANTEHFQQALLTKKEHQREQSQKEQELTHTIAQMQARIDSMQEQHQRMQEEREQMMTMHSAALASHQALLARLRVEEAERLAQMEAEMRVKTSTLSSFQSRETSLEAEQILYTHIAAQTQRELEDKSRQLDRVLAEKRWIEADQQSLNDQLNAMKSRTEEQQKQIAAVQASSREKLQAMQEQLASAKQQLIAEQAQHAELQRELERVEAEHDQQTALSSAASRSDGEWEERMRTVTEHLMQKTSQLDRLSAERTALSVQLDDARAKMSSMERQLKAERDRPHREDIDVESNFPSKLATNGDDSRNAHARKSMAGRSVVHAMTALDRLGAMTGLLLRRHAYVRVAFVVYVALIHLWVLFILVHLTGEMDTGLASASATTAAGIVQSNAALSPMIRSRGDGLGNG